MKRVLCCLDAVKEHNEGDYERAGVVSKCFQNFVSYEVPSTPNLSARAPRPFPSRKPFALYHTR
jgi:hypothetical protein